MEWMSMALITIKDYYQSFRFSLYTIVYSHYALPGSVYLIQRCSLHTLTARYIFSLHYTRLQNSESEGVAAQQATARSWVDVPQGYSAYTLGNWWLDGWLCWW